MVGLFIMSALLISSASARPQTPAPDENSTNDKDARIVASTSEQDDNSYKYTFQTSNGIYQGQSGSFEQLTFETGIAEIQGYYTYVGPDNIRYTVTYVADDKGYRPQLHRTPANLVPQVVNENGQESLKIEGVDDDRIGTKLLITLSGGGGLG